MTSCGTAPEVQAVSAMGRFCTTKSTTIGCPDWHSSPWSLQINKTVGPLYTMTSVPRPWYNLMLCYASISLLSYACYMPHPYHHWFHRPADRIYAEGYKIWGSSLFIFSVLLILLSAYIRMFSPAPCSKTPSVCVFPLYANVGTTLNLEASDCSEELICTASRR
jgi:hypothetical protein